MTVRLSAPSGFLRRFVTLAILVPVTATALVVSGATAALAAPAEADARATQRKVDSYLAAHPGGTQLNATEIAYSGGAFIVTVERAELGVLAAADCPSGWFCFYDGVNFTYPRGRLSDCGWQDLGTWGWRNRTDSAHYNLSTGSVTFLHEAGATDTSLFSVSTTRRTIADVNPHRNRADYVYRTSC